MAAYKAAVEQGVSPVEFWELTPYLTGVAAIAMSNGSITRTWMLAGLMRSKVLPPLKTLLAGAEKQNRDDLACRLKSALAGVAHKANKK